MKSPASLIYVVAGLCVGLLGIVLFLFHGGGERESREIPEPFGAVAVEPAGTGEEEGEEEAPSGGYLSPENEKVVVLFFQSEAGDRLFPELRTILRTASVGDQAKQVIMELISGSKEGHLPVVPPETRLRELYLAGDDILCVDFSQELVDHHSGGSADEIATVFAIVNSLTVNFPEFRKVRILVEGEERETLKYHIDLTRAYQQDLSLVEEIFL